MRICIYSEDAYFTLGLAVHLSLMGYEPYVPDPEEESIAQPNEKDRPRAIIIDSNKREKMERILQSYSARKTCAVFIDAYQESIKHSTRFSMLVSRKLSGEAMAKEIIRHLNRSVPPICPLSLPERIITCLLLHGETPGDIGRTLNISVKTISHYKLNAIKKAGIKRINNKSLLCLGEYLDKVILLNDFYGVSPGIPPEK
ncbi:hypothetical protein AAGR22_12770 [Erwinia sp. HDF1-3R]|uniref:hypothetical protein n=1 Tax=Erwinia sp. HDF1-3R TaxID=3141543 RepID=UPI0031F4C09E